MNALRLRRVFLFTMIASLSLAALLGVAVLIFERTFRSFGERTLSTALTIALFSLISLGCARAWERQRRRGSAAGGLVLAAVSFVAFQAYIWLEQYVISPWEDLFIKGMVLGTIWSVLLALLCQLGLARLRRGWTWVNTATQIVAGILAAALSVTILYDILEEEMFRFIGVLAILTACGTICVPILHRLSALPATDQGVTTRLALTVVCPRCNTRQELPLGRSRCRKCKLSFNVEIEEEHCRNCGYVLYKLTSDRCPECGTPISPPE